MYSHILTFAIYASIILLGPACKPVFAHSVPLHKRISSEVFWSAEEQSYGFSLFLDSITELDESRLYTSGNQALNPIGWFVLGAAIEDGVDIDAGGKRSYNHFYDPLSGQGLSNLPPDRMRNPFGVPSFAWATTLNCPGVNFQFFGNKRIENLNTLNQWSWQNARQFELIGLIDPSPSVRSDALAKMFRCLGQVVHLLEDTTSPQHVRNEQHVDEKPLKYFYESAIEKFGAKNVGKFNYPHSQLDWRGVSFQKVRDFWDRDLQVWDRSAPTAPDASPLVDSEDPNKPARKLGLAEFTNGNFLGERHTYAELVPTASGSYYPFPSLLGGTDWNQLRANPALGKLSLYGSGRRYIVAKTQQGRQVTHHAAVTYIMADAAGLSTPSEVKATIDDPDVLMDYHNQLIPEAIKYSTGLVDYFFRSDLRWTASAINGKITLNIVTGQYNYVIPGSEGIEDISGGALALYYTDGSGNRALVPGQTSDYTGFAKAHTSAINLTFTPPAVDVAYYTLVYYNGTVGVNPNSQPYDSVDSGRMVIASSFSLLWYTITASDNSNLNLREVFQESVYPYQEIPYSQPDPLHSGDTFAGMQHDVSPPSGDYTLTVKSTFNTLADHTISCTLRTFYNTASTPIRTDNFTITATQGDFGSSPPYGFTGTTVKIDQYHALGAH